MRFNTYVNIGIAEQASKAVVLVLQCEKSARLDAKFATRLRLSFMARTGSCANYMRRPLRAALRGGLVHVGPAVRSTDWRYFEREASTPTMRFFWSSMLVSAADAGTSSDAGDAAAATGGTVRVTVRTSIQAAHLPKMRRKKSYGVRCQIFLSKICPTQKSSTGLRGQPLMRDGPILHCHGPRLDHTRVCTV